MVVMFLAAASDGAFARFSWAQDRAARIVTRIMRCVEGGDLDVAIPQRGYVEISDLASAFQRMLGRIKLLMHQNAQEQEQKRLYELDALQAQINPHFLYNTLDSIVWMQERGQNQDAILMVTALARLFRISISKGRSIITVAEELEHARNYLIIQSIRFKNKFTYSIEAQPEALGLRTLKLILQPLWKTRSPRIFAIRDDEGPSRSRPGGGRKPCDAREGQRPGHEPGNGELVLTPGKAGGIAFATCTSGSR